MLSKRCIFAVGALSKWFFLYSVENVVWVSGVYSVCKTVGDLCIHKAQLVARVNVVSPEAEFMNIHFC
jgi:hypothetical protein